MNGTTNISFSVIKTWIQDHLKKQNTLLHCNNAERKIVIHTITGYKYIKIPPKTDANKEEWIKSWIKVYQTCLDALEEKVQFLCMNDPLVSHVSGYKIRVGEKTIILPSDVNDVTYMNTLEEIVNLYDLLKKQEKEKQKNKPEEKPIVVSYRTVQIDKPSLLVPEEKTEKAVEVVRIPDPNLELKKSIEDAKEAINKARNTYNKIRCQKIADDDLLSKTDCNRFKEQNDSYVLVTCTNLNKGEDIFIANADLCMQEKIPMGAFISGKAINKEQGDNESKKIIKLLSNYKMQGPILYEINNTEIRNNHNDNDKILSIVDTSFQVADELSKMGYKILICMDLDIEKIIKNVHNIIRPNFEPKYKSILRILPREKEDIDESKSTVLMDPIYDYDIVTIKY